MQQSVELDQRDFEERKEVFTDIVAAFSESYGFLGEQVATECLMSLATWNMERHSDPPIRYRTHIMLTWDPGYIKSTLLRKFKLLLGDDMVSKCGKITEAVLRGSSAGGSFSPPKVLKAPILVSTEFGQTEWEGELLGSFLALLEEGETNISLNKFAGLSDVAKRDVTEKYHGDIEFTADNEFDLYTDFLFWGATHDPEQLQDNAMVDRFNIVTPKEPLTGELVEQVSKSPPLTETLSKDTIQSLRRIVSCEKEADVDFEIPSALYRKHNPSFRLARDVRSNMAARHWWGLQSDPDVMDAYMQHLKESRKKASMNKYERVQDMIFENPLTWDEILERARLPETELNHILQNLDVTHHPGPDGETQWVIRNEFKNSSSNTEQKEEEKTKKEDVLERLR
jgi:hypothetical protein